MRNVAGPKKRCGSGSAILAHAAQYRQENVAPALTTWQWFRTALVSQSLKRLSTGSKRSRI